MPSLESCGVRVYGLVLRVSFGVSAFPEFRGAGWIWGLGLVFAWGYRGVQRRTLQRPVFVGLVMSHSPEMEA